MLVEVKGLAGKGLSVELTPNEYEQILSPRHRGHYVVYVVVQADKPKLAKPYIFRYHSGATEEAGRPVWFSREGLELAIEERTGARLKLAK